MIKSLSKNLEGMPEVKQALDAFAANYDENIQSEEKLAELVGLLAGNYAQMNKPSQNLIKRFLDRLAKMFGLKTFTDGEVVDLLNTIAGKVAVGEEIEFGDINIIGLNGDIEVTGKPRKSLIGSIELKRFPVNSNTKVKENIPMSKFDGKVSNLFESDRMTGAFIEDKKGNPLFSFYGGLMYPSITGKWWASRLLSKAKSIAKNANKNRDKDGYIYGTPIIMNPGSHMSNQDMFEAVWSTMKHDLKNKKSKVTKEKFYNMIMKSLSLKLTRDIDVNISKNESIDSMISKLNNLFESKDLSFEKRKTIIKSLLGDPKKVSDRNFPSAGSILEIAEKFEEPLTKKSETLWDIVVVMRTKGNLEAKVTPKTDEFYHNSYPAEISSDAPIEMFILDGAYNITEVFPTLKKSDGQTISWQDYSERHGKKSEKNARSQYGRTSKLSYASGEITTPAKRKQLVAPNGKPSNLNQEQYELVRTPAFKNWFGDWQNDPKNASKVVDENGEPMVVYHGSTVPDIEVFDRSKSGRERSGLKEMGIYFSTNQELSNIYANAERSKDYDREVRTEIYQLKQVLNKVRNNREYDSIIKRIELLEKGKVYPVFLNIRDMVTFDAKFDSNAEAWNDLKVKASYKTATGRDAMEFLSPQVSKERNLERFGVKPVNGIKAKNIVEASYSYRKDGYNVIPQITEKVKNTQDYKDFVKKYGGDAFLLFDGQPQNIKLADGSNKTFDPQEPSIRKQKDDGPSRERVDKIIDGIVKKLEDRRLKKLEKDRTRGPLTAKEKLDATISYLKGSKLYQESTDLEREQIVRQITEDLGIKIKKAPPVRKVLGKKKRTKVVVDQLAEYKRQIKEWNKSARLAKKDLNTRRKELAKLVKSMVRQGIMTSKQAGILVERSNIVNLENEEILNRFLDYAEKVFKNAEYAEKLRQASAIRRKIKRNLKKDNQAEVIAMAKQFADIDPQMVEVLDLYMDYAEQMNDALKSSRIKGGEVDMRQAANLAEIAEFYQGAIDNQNKILKKEMIAKYQDLNLDENMSINEIKEIVEAIESGDVKQGLEAEVMSFLTKRFGVMSAIAKDMIKRKINPFTGETIDLTDHQIDMVSRLVDADLSAMDVKDAIKFVEYIDNFITNEITSGLESAISIYEGVRSIRNLAKRLIKARMPKLGFSESIGKIWNQYLTSMPVLFDRIFQGTNRGLKVMKEIGLQDIINGKAKKIEVHKKIMDQYKKKFIEGDKTFMDADNVYERGMVAFMSRNLVGTVAEQKAEFERRKRLVLESIEYLENSGNKQERKKAAIYREVYDKLNIASAKDINSIRDKASKKNIDAVSWWTDQWADKYNDLADVSLSVHNTILGTDTNYTPDKYKTLSSRVDISKEDLARSVEETGAFMSGTHIDRNKSGVLMETTRPKTLPKNRYVSFDFDMDNSLSMDKALTDIYTSAAIQKFYGATRSSSFEEVFGDTSSMVLERVSDYIRDLKGKGEYMSNKEISKIFNTVAKFGVSKALGGMSQALKQTIPVMMNTLTNAGRFDFANKSDLNWVNNSDMAIVNRGIESETAIESADASVEVNLDSIRKIMRGVDKLQELYLKAFLQGPDVYVAKSSFISYYKQHMQRNGLSTELVEGEYNQDALEYAQMMVDRQQNVSDPALAGTFLSKAGNVAIVRKVIAPFASFVINQKGRMMADLRVLNPTNTTSTNEDKKAAARSLAGLMVELTVFHTLSAVIREGFKGAAKGLFGDDDEDKEEKEWGSLESNKKLWDASRYAFSSVVKDVLSPFPAVGDGLISEGLNMLLENLDVNLADEDDVQAAIDEENELRLLKRKDPMTEKEKKELREKVMEQGKISVYEDDAVLKTLGVFSIGKDAMKDLNDAYMLYKDGEYEDKYGNKNYLLKRDREGLGSIVLGKFFTVTGLAPKDVGDIARYGMKEIKKKSISEKQYEKYQEVKKDLKRNPTEAEEYLIVNSRRKAKDITDDINRINKYFEGLTLDQMKEFVETEKYGLFRGSWAIRNIKEGKTAKELTKERNIPTESKSMFSTRKGE